MKVEVHADADAVARAAAAIIAAEARVAVRMRGRFILAVSGGNSPVPMFRVLAREEVPWNAMHIFQVDERIAPIGHPDRNLTLLRDNLFELAPLREEQIHAMPVDSTDLDAAAASYGQTLTEIGGSPPILDLVHLGLGTDGHTASLVPNDPAMDITGSDVALTGVYQRWRRMTLTYPVLDRSRRILWIVTGREKSTMLLRLQAGDLSIPAARVNRTHAVVVADSAAAG